MAWGHVELVRELRLPPTTKLILFALASRANKEDQCWPSIGKLCADTGLQRRTVQLHLARLVKQGVVVRETRSGRSNVLRLNLEARSEVTGPIAGVANATSAADHSLSKGCTTCTPPAHVVHPPVHQVHPTCASHAPEVKREENKKQKEKEQRSVDSVDRSDLNASFSEAKWWKTEAGMIAKGVELAQPAAPGESGYQYRQRLFRAIAERERQRSTRSG